VKVHYTGSTENTKMLTDHALCDDRVRSIQNGHMDGQGWNDVGYTALVCPHGYVYEGRGLNRLPAANGKGLNSGHYAVCGLVGNKGLVTPTPLMLHGIRDAIEWLRSKGDAGNEIKGHRDGYATDCPGGPLYAWVKKGAPRPDQEDDDMEPTTTVDIPEYWEGKQFSHGKYSAAFLWAGSLSETRAYGKAMLAKQDAMQVTIDKLVDALGSGTIMTPEQVEALKTSITEAIDGIVVRVDVAEE
jgi:hypothetical protein